jgi:ERCC4-type nuclease
MKNKMTFLNIFSKTKNQEKTISITVDHREKNSLVISELSKLNIQADFKQLPVADYIIKDTAIERKTLSDFKSSIINKRIISQLLELKQYPKHLLILEGLDSTDPYSGQIHENAFRGFMLAVALEYQVPVIFTLNEKDTAKYISVLAKKPKPQETSIRPTKIFLNKKEQMQFILEGFPNIGPTTAKKLLKHFKTLSNIFTASQDQLKQIIGKKAEAFEILTKK